MGKILAWQVFLDRQSVVVSVAGNDCLCCCNTGAETISPLLLHRAGGDACVNNRGRRILEQRDIISCGRLLKAIGEN